MKCEDFQINDGERNQVGVCQKIQIHLITFKLIKELSAKTFSLTEIFGIDGRRYPLSLLMFVGYLGHSCVIFCDWLHGSWVNRSIYYTLLIRC